VRCGTGLQGIRSYTALCSEFCLFYLCNSTCSLSFGGQWQDIGSKDKHEESDVNARERGEGCEAEGGQGGGSFNRKLMNRSALSSMPLRSVKSN
jgi:hypothetical protein